MVRGCEKRIYYVKNTGGEIFDEAYLVMRPRARRQVASPREIEAEAQRIVNGALSLSGGGASSLRKAKFCAFAAGAVLSAVILGAVFLLILL